MAWCRTSYTGCDNHDGSIDAYRGRWRPGRSDLLHSGPTQGPWCAHAVEFSKTAAHSGREGSPPTRR